MSNAKPVAIKVHIEDDPTQYPPKSPYKFWLGTDDSKIGSKKGHKLIFSNVDGAKNYDGFDIVFEIQDDTKPRQGFKFMDNKQLADGSPDPDCAPMWVKTINDFSEDCPDKQFWEQFYTDKVTANNTKLHVRNVNSSVQKFKFALMFSRTPDNGPCEAMYDPDGTNQNGPKLYSSSLLLAVAVIGTLAGAALTLGIQSLS